MTIIDDLKGTYQDTFQIGRAYTPPVNNWDAAPKAYVDAQIGGDVVGPAGAVADNFASFNGITGKIIKDSGYNGASFDIAGAAAGVQGNLNTHLGDFLNPHAVTKTQVGLGNVPDVDCTNPANIVQTASYRFVTDIEKATWNGKQDPLTPAGGTGNYDILSGTTIRSLKEGSNISISLLGGVLTLSAVGFGSGDVVGPASSTDHAICRFHETTGKIIQDYTSGAPTISDIGFATFPNGVTSPKTDSALYHNEIYGNGAGASLTTAPYTTAVGYNALNLMQDGIYNTAIGAGAMMSATNAGGCTAVGTGSLMSIVNTLNCTAVGFNASGLSLGYAHTAVGASALGSLVNGNYNTVIGADALSTITEGSNMVALGFSAGGYETDATKSWLFIDGLDRTTEALGRTNSLLVGNMNADPTLQTLTTNSFFTATYGMTSPKNQTGLFNEFYGVTSGNLTTTGNYNSAVGVNTLNAITSGSDLAAMGYYALKSNTSGLYNSAFGSRSLYSVTTGSSNIGVGYRAGYQISTGTNNIAIGHNAMLANTGGTSDIGIGRSALYNNTGNYNVALGHEAGFTTVATSSSVFIGYQAGYYETASNKLFIDNVKRDDEPNGRAKALIYGVFAANPASQTLTTNSFFTTTYGITSPKVTAGQYNEIYGYQSGNSLTTGINHVAVGYQALYSMVISTDNVAIGHQALYNSVNIGNVAVGSQSLYGNTSGYSNTAVGLNASKGNTSGNSNTSIGYQAGYGCITGSRNIFIGYRAGYYESGSDKLYIDNELRTSASALIYGVFNTTPSSQTLTTNSFFTTTYGITSPKIASSYFNEIYGALAGAALTTGNLNTGLGYLSLNKVTTGYENTSVGANTLQNMTVTYGHTAVGASALKNCTTGSINTAVGRSALTALVSGNANVAVGNGAGGRINGGSFNTLVGTSSGEYIVNTHYNTCIGYQAGYTATGAANVMLGFCAGKYETGSNSYYVDSIDRINTAGDKAGALLYGTFNATPANQTLVTNSAFTATYGITTNTIYATGAGQNVESLISTTAGLGGAIGLKDTNSSSLSGGMVMFGASNGYFAAIKGAVEDNNPNCVGNIVLATRGSIADGTLTARMIVHYDGKIGVATVAPMTNLHVAASTTDSPRGIMSSQHNDGTDCARFHGRKSRGTLTSPTVIVAGDCISSWYGSGYDGSNYLEMAAIQMISEGTIAATRVPTSIVFSTATNTTPSVLTEAMRIDSSQVLTVLKQLTSTLAIGISPFAVTSTTVNTNLNADLLDGYHAGVSANNVALLDANGALNLSKSQDASFGLSVTNTNVGASAWAGMTMISDGGTSYIYRSSIAASISDATIIQDAGGGDIVFYGAAQLGRFTNAGLLFAYSITKDITQVNERQLYWDASTGEVKAGLAPVSSKRYKTDIKSLKDNPLNLLKVESKSFKYIETGVEDIGMIAEDVDEVGCVGLVKYSNGVPEALKYDKIPIYHHEILRSHESRIKELENEIETLKKSMAA